MLRAIAKAGGEVESRAPGHLSVTMFVLCSVSRNGRIVMRTREIAEDVVAMSNAGNLDGIGAKYWADAIVSIEDMAGPMARLEGRQAVEAKGAWWNGAHEVHSVETHGPFVNGDQFAVRWVMDVTQKESGNRITMDEMALYTVKDGKIVEERFFY
jgi:ketosteroid isomerase-like protein